MDSLFLFLFIINKIGIIVAINLLKVNNKNIPIANQIFLLLNKKDNGNNANENISIEYIIDGNNFKIIIVKLKLIGNNPIKCNKQIGTVITKLINVENSLVLFILVNDKI